MDTAIFRESCFVSIPSISSVPKFGFRRSLLFSSVQLHNRRLPRYPPFRRAAIVGVTSSSQPSSKGFVDVISIGSRKDAVIDHCLQSPVASNRLRFWTIDSRNSQKVQLLRRTLGGDILQNVEFLLSLPPRPSAAILERLKNFNMVELKTGNTQIVTAGYGLDDIRALELLNSVKSEGGLTVAVLLKPFCFEGQRRQKEVNHLVDKLRKCSHFYVVVETDALLKTEEETLEDAIRIVNNAILASINMISTLSDDGYLKFLDTAQEEIKGLNFSQIVKLLEKCGETKVGFGTGYDVRSSISQAVFNCPFLTSDMKGSGGIVIFNLASATTVDKDEAFAVIHTFRRVAKCHKDMVYCGVHEPGLEQNLVFSTLFVISCNEQKISKKKGFFSNLVDHFPMFFSLLTRDHSEKSDLQPDSCCTLVDDCVLSGRNSSGMEVGDDVPESLHSCPERDMESCSIKKDGSNEDNISISEDEDSMILEDYFKTGENSSQREQLTSWIFGPGFQSAQIWAEERAVFSETTKRIDEVEFFQLPVGVRLPQQTDGRLSSVVTDSGIKEDKRDGAPDSPTFPLMDKLDAVVDMRHSVSANIRGKPISSRKQKLLSSRAALMLEAERERGKQWAPIVEMDYRGGFYRGRCQGGLPEGKGCLTLTDGSFYDGKWRYGKRSGFGTFYQSNGDVFQGTWRDDLFHGKGWFYFRGGDRWFANFWKGKANGEGRFYSKSGSIFFGYFRNGWRHGECLCIDADGTRWDEIWEDGVLVHRKAGAKSSG